MQARCPICYGALNDNRREYHPRCHDIYRKHYKRLRLVRTREVNRSLNAEETVALRASALAAATDDYASSSSGS